MTLDFNAKSFVPATQRKFLVGDSVLIWDYILGMFLEGTIQHITLHAVWVTIENENVSIACKHAEIPHRLVRLPRSTKNSWEKLIDSFIRNENTSSLAEDCALRIVG